MTFELSFFNYKTDNLPKSKIVTWDEFVLSIKKPIVRRDKDGVLFSGARFAPKMRAKQNVVDLSLIGFDLDHDAEFAQIKTALNKLQCVYAIYSTHSHLRISENNKNAEPRFRAVLPLAAPIPADKFESLWNYLKNKTGLNLDESCKDASRMFYAPAVFAESAEYVYFESDYIDLLDWRKLDLSGIQGTLEASDNPNAENSANLFVEPKPLFELPEIISDGARNATLTRLAGVMRRAGMIEPEIAIALSAVNKRAVSPPLDAGELNGIARSVGRYESNNQVESVSDDGKLASWDDISIARLFAAQSVDKIRYQAESKKWLLWTGTHWKTDKTDEVIRRGAAFAQNLYTKIYDLSLSKAELGEAHKQVKRSNSNNGLTAFVNISKAYLGLEASELDRNPYILNCKNGTVNLRTGKLLPHNTKDFCTKIAPFDYEAGAADPFLDDFLTTIQPNPIHRDFLQRSIGYSLLGVARERAFWILYGGGNNGKSVFTDIVGEILGDYSSATTSDSVMNRKADRIPNDIARLRGQRFVVIPETEENERINAALIKALSAGDKITARFLFGEFFDFYFSGKLWIATNHKPTITDHSRGFWDRLKLIPFTTDIPKEKIIKKDTLLQRLTDGAPAFLNWMITGTQLYLNNNDLQVPASIQSEIDLYKYEQDSIAQFLDEASETGINYSVSNKELYARYKEFCSDNGEELRSHKRLSQNLKERGFEQDKSGARYWNGLRLKVN